MGFTNWIIPKVKLLDLLYLIVDPFIRRVVLHHLEVAKDRLQHLVHVLVTLLGESDGDGEHRVGRIELEPIAIIARSEGQGPDFPPEV